MPSQAKPVSFHLSSDLDVQDDSTVSKLDLHRLHDGIFDSNRCLLVPVLEYQSHCPLPMVDLRRRHLQTNQLRVSGSPERNG